MHYFGTFDDSALAAPDLYAGRGEGYRQALLIGPHTGSVHTGLSVAQLDPGGVLAPHIHSFEEGFYILEGDAILAIGDGAVRLRAGDYGAVKVGIVHGWRNAGGGRLRWLQMQAPQPKPAGAERDTFFPRARACRTPPTPRTVSLRAVRPPAASSGTSTRPTCRRSTSGRTS
jgi:quercetin dioxygenase-like cupin family protein